MQASLADEKLQRIRSFSDLFQTTARVTKREMLSLLGYLTFTMRIIPQDRSPPNGGPIGPKTERHNIPQQRLQVYFLQEVSSCSLERYIFLL